MFVKKGDTVKVISGDNKGKIGKVLKVLVSDNRVVVEGVNIISRHTRPSNANPDGGIIKKEAPIAISNVMVYDTKASQVSRVGYKEENGKKVRFAKKSGNLLDK
ncbi:MAG: 50S ribosomal protein L24 [Bacilli bacterium]|nr:50S ribosomal protein L24 [Bacilli bacterium]